MNGGGESCGTTIYASPTFLLCQFTNVSMITRWIVLALVAVIVSLSCARGGEVVYRSPHVADDRTEAGASVGAIAENRQPAVIPTAAPVGGAAITPDPASLNLISALDLHHPLDLVSSRSAVITADTGGRPVVIHNDPDLLGRDACSEATLSPEGDTRLTLILPEPGTETRSRFYLVACEPGEATLQIMSEGELLNRYTFTVAGP